MRELANAKSLLLRANVDSPAEYKLLCVRHMRLRQGHYVQFLCNT